MAMHRGLLRYYWPLVMIVAVSCSLAWLGETCARLSIESKILKQQNADFIETAKRQAQEEFDSGDFRKAAFLLKPVGFDRPDDTGLELLRAHIYECSGDFNDAANSYQRVVSKSDATFEVREALFFCRRMANPRRTPMLTPSREVLYRLHGELMRRGQYAQARFIALDLRPDLGPLRESTSALLSESDSGVEIAPASSGQLVDVTASSLTPATAGLLHDLGVGTLSAPDTGISSTATLAGLDVQTLNLSHNPLGDISGLRSMTLHSLNISDCPVADIGALAGMPLRELNLAHTKVSSLYPLLLCPLEDLNLAGLPVRDLTPLRGLALKYLDLSHTKVDEISALENLPLKSLRIGGTKVHDLKPLANTRLHTLDISGTPVNDISPLAGMPLVELDLRGCTQITDFTPLETCVKLQQLYLPKGAHVPAALMHLPRLKLIMHG